MLTTFDHFGHFSWRRRFREVECRDRVLVLGEIVENGKERGDYLYDVKSSNM